MTTQDKATPAARREQQYQALMADPVDYDEEPLKPKQAEEIHRAVRAEVAAARRTRQSRH